MEEILTDSGDISHEVAQALALKEYEVFKNKQDCFFESDFDRYIKKHLVPDTCHLNFAKVIDKAILACENSGYNVDDHFAEVSKMIEVGKGGKRNTGI